MTVYRSWSISKNCHTENGAFVLRICKTEAEIQVIETNLEKSELVKEIVPLVFDGLVNNYQTILDKFNIDIHVESYIDVSQLSLDDIDIAKEVGIGLRLVNPIFDEINRIKFTIDSMDEEFLENVRVKSIIWFNSICCWISIWKSNSWRFI